MTEHGFKSPTATLESIGLSKVKTAYWNLPPAELVQHSLDKGMGRLTDAGALAVNTGKFTGRSPKDKFTVKDTLTENTVDWGDINIPISPENFDNLYAAVTSYLDGKEVYVRDAYACADPKHRLNIRVVNEYPWANLFCYDLFFYVLQHKSWKPNNPNGSFCKHPDMKPPIPPNGVYDKAILQ